MHPKVHHVVEGIKDECPFCEGKGKPSAEMSLSITKGQTCCLCGGKNDQYMVHKDIWIKSGIPDNYTACLACLEKALRRELVAADFNEKLGINAPILYGFKHANRNK